MYPEGPTICFIATASFGSKFATEVEFLRQFRDTILKDTPTGDQLFSKFYEKYNKVGPHILKEMLDDPETLAVVRFGIANPIVNYLKIAYDFPDADIGNLEEPWKSFLINTRNNLEKWLKESLEFAHNLNDIDIWNHYQEANKKDAINELDLILRFVLRSIESRFQFLEELMEKQQLPILCENNEYSRFKKKLQKSGRTIEEINKIIKKKRK